MIPNSDTIRCDGCGAEILLAPVARDERLYCCEECANNRPCPCAERQDFGDEPHTRSVNDAIEVLLLL